MSKWERERALKALAVRGRGERDARAIGQAVLEQRAIEEAGVVYRGKRGSTGISG